MSEFKKYNFFRSEEANKNFNPKAYAQKETDALMLLSDAILLYFKQGKKDEARGAMDAVLSRCIACHQIIRKW